MPEKEDVSRHVHAIMKAAISTLPTIGNPLSSLLGDYLPNRRLDRLERFLKQLDLALRDIVLKLDADNLGFLVEKAMRVAAADHRQFKRAMLTSAIHAAAIDGSTVAVSKARTFIDLIDALEPHHIALLNCLAETGTADFPTLQAALATGPDVPPELRDDFAIQALSYLCNVGLVRGAGAAGGGLVLSAMSPPTMWKVGKYAISNLGREFIEHLRARRIPPTSSNIGTGSHHITAPHPPSGAFRACRTSRPANLRQSPPTAAKQGPAPCFGPLRANPSLMTTRRHSPPVARATALERCSDRELKTEN